MVHNPEIPAIADERNFINNIFFSVARSNFSLKSQTLEWFNSVFGTNMQNGIFRVVNIRFECPGYDQMDPGHVMSIQNECMNIIQDNLDEFCHHILFANDFLICRGLFNYSPSNEKKIRSILESTLEAIKKMPRVTAVFVSVTIGLSLPFDEIVDANRGLQEAMEAIWLKFSKGSGRVIEWEKSQALPAVYLKNLENYRRRLKKACVLLDINMFEQAIREFFSLPKRILSSMETRALLYDVEQYMYEVNRGPISEFSDVALVHKAMRDTFKKVTTLDEYLDCYTVHFTSLFKDIIRHTPKYNKMVREAEFFVQENMAKEIRLNDVASQIGLNDVYFSHLFKKTTGVNFTDYVVGCKIDAAKKYLTGDKIKIDAIAALTGFADAKYFSRKFREREGISPSEYRKFNS